MKRKFTIIELLVVVAIIGILMSMLMPALNSAKKKAKTVQCLSQMRQIYAASAMYLNDNDGRYPYGSTSDFKLSWDDFLANYDGRGYNYAEYSVLQMTTTDAAKSKHRLYRCPGSKWPDEANVLRSYSMNSGYNYYDYKGIGHYGWSIKVTQINDASDTLLFVERDQKVHNLLSSQSGGMTWYTLHYTWHDSIVQNPHGTNSNSQLRNMTYSDGSVKTVDLQDTISPSNQWTRETGD